MKIQSLLIENFRGISRVSADDLGDTIIIAGQNGSGKSCIFDAIRLLKSTYGGYQQNEWQQFFGEFAIQLHGGAKNLQGLFNNPSKPLRIVCRFQLRETEKTYIASHLAELLEEAIWQTLLPEAFQWGGYRKALFANQFRERQPEVTERVKKELPELEKAIAQPNIVGAILITPQGEVSIQNSRLLSVIFTNYRPNEIGVIDFHGAQRHYGRENVQGINLSLDQKNQQFGQHSLYNYNNKYNNVKSEMAGNYVKELLAEKARAGIALPKSLGVTLAELFESFFPDKKFLGPQPTVDGSLSFPVQTAGGSEHDLDELSSGEKEILYGYLRIRSSAPKDSIILLDEPELHLNPRLIRGLPEFYRKNLGEALKNQIWLVTHSDALIREAVGKPGFNVFHMTPCGAVDTDEKSQLRPLIAHDGLEMAIADLVGDLAAYRPGGKGLIFEGGGDSDFDKTFVGALFADELRGINLLSGSNKARVRQLHDVLQRAYKKGDLPTKFYAILDKDSDLIEDDSQVVNRFVWDVYHVENYLLEPSIILDVLKSLSPHLSSNSEQLLQKLEQAARDVIPNMLQHRIRIRVNAMIVDQVNLKFDPNTKNLCQDLRDAVHRSVDRINTQFTTDLTFENLKSFEKEIQQEIEKSFADNTWRANIPGREILKRFIDRESIPVGYEIFRNLIVSRMTELGHKPQGMSAVIDKVVKD